MQMIESKPKMHNPARILVRKYSAEAHVRIFSAGILTANKVVLGLSSWYASVQAGQHQRLTLGYSHCPHHRCGNKQGSITYSMISKHPGQTPRERAYTSPARSAFEESYSATTRAIRTTKFTIRSRFIVRYPLSLTGTTTNDIQDGYVSRDLINNFAARLTGLHKDETSALLSHPIDDYLAYPVVQHCPYCVRRKRHQSANSK